MQEFFKNPEKSHGLKKSAILIGLVLVLGIGAYMLAGSSLFKGSTYIHEMDKLGDNVKSYNYAGSSFQQEEDFTNEDIEFGEESSWEVLAGDQGAFGALFASKKVDGKSIGSWRVLKAGFQATAATERIEITSVNNEEQNLRSDGTPPNIVERCIFIDRNFDSSFAVDEEEQCYSNVEVLPSVDAPYLINDLTPGNSYNVAVVIKDADGRKDWEVTPIRMNAIPEGTGTVTVVEDPADNEAIEASTSINCEEVSYSYSEDLSSVDIEWAVKLDASAFDPALNAAQDNWLFDWDLNEDNFTTLEGNGITINHEYPLPDPFTGPASFEASVRATFDNGDDPAASATGTCRTSIPAPLVPDTEEPITIVEEPVPADDPVATETMDVRAVLVASGGSFYDYPGFYDSSELRVYGIFKAIPSANGAVINDATLNWSATYKNAAAESVTLDSSYIIPDAVYPQTQDLLAANEVLMAFPTPPGAETWYTTVTVQASATVDGQTLAGEKTINLTLSADKLSTVINGGIGGSFIDSYTDVKYYSDYSISAGENYFGKAEVEPVELEPVDLDYAWNSVFGAIVKNDMSYDVVYADTGASVFFKPNCDASALDGAVRIIPADSLPDGEKGALQDFYQENLFTNSDDVAVFDIEASDSCSEPETPEEVVVLSADLSLDCTIRKTDQGTYEEVLTVTTDAHPHTYTWEYDGDATPNSNGVINLNEAPVSGQKVRETIAPEQGASYSVALIASTTTKGDLSARTECKVPQVQISCEVDPAPINKGENAGQYSAGTTASATGFNEDSVQHQWKQSSPVESQSVFSSGLPGFRSLLINPYQGFSTTEHVEVSDRVHGTWDATTECKIPPRITCEQDAGGNARITTYGISTQHYANGYKWVFGDEEEAPVDAETYYSDPANYSAEFGSESDPSHPSQGHSYEDSKSHTVNLHMHGTDDQGESTYTSLSAACPGDDAPVIDAVDDPEVGVNQVDSFDTLQGNPISVYQLKNDTFDAVKLDTVAWPVAEVPAQDSPDFNQDARYVTVEIIKNEPEYEINGQAFLGINASSPGIVETIEYTPDPDFTGLEKIKYKITDVESGVYDTAIVRINVKPAEPTGSLACSVDGSKATLTANFDRIEAFNGKTFAVIWYQDGEIFDANIISADELDKFVDKQVEYEHNSTEDFGVSMVIIPVNNNLIKPIALIDGNLINEGMANPEGIDISIDPADLANLLHYKYDANCTVPEDAPVPTEEKPVPPANSGENYCSIVNTNTNISDSDINQSEQSVDCSVNIDNSITNYYYYPENVKETVLIEKIPKDPDPEKTETKEEIAATGDVKTGALTCYKPGEVKNYKDADKFGYYKRFVEEFTKIDAVSPGDYKKGDTELSLTPKPIVKGYADDNFKVFSNTTRTEGLKMISNGTCLFQDLNDANILSLSDQAKKDAAAVYKDFPSDHWAKIMAGVSSDNKVEMTEGYKDGTFRPDQPITKAEYGKILVARFCVQQPDECASAKAKIKKEAAPFKERFPDLVGHWGGGEDGWITLGNELKIILGTTDGKFYPDSYITRGDALVLLHNYVVARGLLDDAGNIVKIETKITR